MNPETTLVWHPLRDRLLLLRQTCLRNDSVPPHWDRIENIAGSGYPDLDWQWDRRRGHIELKHRHSWPAGADTPVVLDTITAHQRLWWRQRWEAGGSVFVLTRVGSSLMLHTGLWACHHLGAVTRQSLLDHCSWSAHSREPWSVEELLTAAQRTRR